jgi:hypothetical protein
MTFNKHSWVRGCSPTPHPVVQIGTAVHALSRKGRATVLFVKRLAMVGGL